MSDWHIYIIQTAKGQLYTGITNDPERRLKQHEEGKGAKFLRGKGPLTMVFHQKLSNHSEAARLEPVIKRWSRQKKLALINNPECWAELTVNIID